MPSSRQEVVDAKAAAKSAILARSKCSNPKGDAEHQYVVVDPGNVVINSLGRAASMLEALGSDGDRGLLASVYHNIGPKFVIDPRL